MKDSFCLFVCLFVLIKEGEIRIQAGLLCSVGINQSQRACWEKGNLQEEEGEGRGRTHADQ